MRETKSQIMEGIEAIESKVLADNTVEYKKPDGTTVIRFHHTDIIETAPDGTITLNSGGWKTMTTKDRMNSFQNVTRIVQEKGLWYVTTNKDESHEKDSWTPFFDGIKIKNGKVINVKKSPHKSELFLLKQIQTYCDKLKKLKELPIPSSGDCWECSFKTEDGTIMGDIKEGNDHLKCHLKEKYIHGSLILNALEYAGYNQPEFIFHHDIRDSIVKAVKKYFKAKLCLVQ